MDESSCTGRGGASGKERAARVRGVDRGARANRRRPPTAQRGGEDVRIPTSNYTEYFIALRQTCENARVHIGEAIGLTWGRNSTIPGAK